MKKVFCFALAVMTMISIGYGSCSDSDTEPRGELMRLLNTGEDLYDFRKADLNGDGFSDYVFIVGPPKSNNVDDCIEGDNRTLKIAVRSFDGCLKIVKSNDRIILCKECEGVFGDPYTGMKAGYKWFSVSHAGGGNNKWYTTFRFRYSRKDDTWQLVLAHDRSTLFVEVLEEYFFKPPRDYGKVDIADFDPDDYTPNRLKWGISN
jgi:hypothetical protein